MDGYGNIKTTISAEKIHLSPKTRLLSGIGKCVCEVVYADGSFTVPEGTLALAPGSSGWDALNSSKPVRWLELFLRGGNAWEFLGRPSKNECIKIHRVLDSGIEDDWQYLGMAI